MLLNGSFHPDFGKVAETLISIIPDKTPGGAALCVYHEGEKVVDIWGGTKDRDYTPWHEDTISFSASTTKGVASTVLHIVMDQNNIDYDEKISTYWPEFGQNGKADITIRQAMCHEAGLYNIADHDLDLDDLLNWDNALKALEEATPAFVPGTANAYHGLTYGHIVGGIAEKISGKPFQQLLKEELADPLGVDGLFIGVPEDQLHRCAKLITFDGHLGKALKSYQNIPKPLALLLYYLIRITGADLKHFGKALVPDYVDQVNFNDADAMQAIIPSANGAFTARSLAKMYAMLANGGELNGHRFLSEETINKLSEIQNKRRDKVITMPMNWRLGYHQAFSFGERAPNAFGHYGFGGSGAFCDPSRNLSMGLTLNSGIGTPTGDLRVIRLARDVAHCARRRHKWAKKKITPGVTEITNSQQAKEAINSNSSSTTPNKSKLDSNVEQETIESI